MFFIRLYLETNINATQQNIIHFKEIYESNFLEVLNLNRNPNVDLDFIKKNNLKTRNFILNKNVTYKTIINNLDMFSTDDLNLKYLTLKF